MAAQPGGDGSAHVMAGEAQPWHLVTDLDFLPASGDFTLVCTDASWNGKANPNDRATAFKVSKEEIARRSSFFQDMFDVSNTALPGGQHLLCGERSVVLSLVLCAALHPEHRRLTHGDSWSDLSAALSLAFKWDMVAVRHRILWAMMDLVTDLQRKFLATGGACDVVPFFAEAALHGTACLNVAKTIWRTRREKVGVVCISRIHLPPRIMVQLSPSVCSDFMQTIVDLRGEGVFGRRPDPSSDAKAASTTLTA